MTNHFDKALEAARVAQEHASVPELARVYRQKASMHALIDIAESLRAQRSDMVQHTGFPQRVIAGDINLADLPLEHVGGVDDDEESGCGGKGSCAIGIADPICAKCPKGERTE